ncbi:MAG: FAD-dependent oxidoreductase [Oscillospiraceae bacterium]|nr:FAD-dependent oxidoreductase [Oscillospiraceae bacterium]
MRADAVVIGGGMAGILCAYFLTRAGVDCLVLEAERVCGGVTAGTTAKLTLQHGLFCHTLLRRFGKERAQMFLASQREALSHYRTLCEKIDCDYRQTRSGVYTLRDRAAIEREVRAFEELGLEARFEPSLPVPLPVVGAVCVDGQAQFHPLKFAWSLAKDLRIREHTRALAITDDGVMTDSGPVRAKSVIVATHFPFPRWRGAYFLKMYQERSYVLALEGAQDAGGMYVDMEKEGLSFRNHGSTLLLGGLSHRTAAQSAGWEPLCAFAKKHYPASREVCRWAAQDCITLDALPYIGRLSRHTPNVYVATGFNKWGMSSSMTAAILLRDLVTGRENPYAALYDPSRTIVRAQLFANMAHSALGLLTPSVPRCTHLGCALKYNKQEHTWDCPCHGSRFSHSGSAGEGPAQKRIKLK